MSQEFKKVLVANRGEIAMRIFRACHDLGLQTIAIYSNEDTYSVFRTAADESYLIGKNLSPLGAYLDIPRIIALAKKHGADAIHPGYGFLSENGDFARAWRRRGIKFIGPSSKVLDLMGDKLSAKQIAVECGVPTTPVPTEPLQSRQAAQKLAMEFGFPVILKAAAGGGGRGMRRCDTVEEVGVNFDLVKAEAKKAFGNDDIFMEKFLVEPKHIEVQVLGDQHGNVVHLFERDCSLQRRYQKVVEFTPAFSVPKKIRPALYEDAVKIAKHVGYVNAGTVEFLVDKEGHHYFIEMNPRIQVEHTVTEMVTGIDLVRAQILIAEDAPPQRSPDRHPARTSGIKRLRHPVPRHHRGPGQQLRPRHRQDHRLPLRRRLRRPAGRRQRLHRRGHLPYYDSLLVKVTSWDNTFEGVCRKAMPAINEVHVRGVKTNIPFITNILKPTPPSIAGQCHTKFIDETPELFQLDESQDRATKMLKYIGNIRWSSRAGRAQALRHPAFPRSPATPGPTASSSCWTPRAPRPCADWVLDQKKLLISDTTMRGRPSVPAGHPGAHPGHGQGHGGHQRDPQRLLLPGVWGGATFDVAYRFLHESPWERLDLLREKVPNIPLPDAAAGRQRRGLHQLSRQRHPGVHQGGRPAASTCSGSSTP